MFTGSLSQHTYCPDCKGLRPNGTTLFSNKLTARIKELLSHEATRESYRFNPDMSRDDVVRCLFDGSVIRDRISHIRGEYDQVVSLFCDGVRVTTMNGKEFYPMVVVFNNLPFHLRYKGEYLFTALMWAGHVDTETSQTHIVDLVDQLKFLLEEGIEVKGIPHKVRVVVAFTSADYRADPIFSGRKQLSSR